MEEEKIEEMSGAENGQTTDNMSSYISPPENGTNTTIKPTTNGVVDRSTNLGRSGSNNGGNNGSEQGFFANLSRIELTYYFQIGIIYIVVITAIVNLSFSNDEGKLWSSLLSSSIGYLLPHPTIPKKRVNYQSSSDY